MDIKSVRNIFNQTMITAKSDVTKKSEIKSDGSTERDANGQMPGRQEESPKDLNEEERQKVLASVKQLAGVKDNNLTVRMQFINDKYFVFIEDVKGKVIRRVDINELAHMLKEKDPSSEKGSFFNRAL